MLKNQTVNASLTPEPALPSASPARTSHLVLALGLMAGAMLAFVIVDTTLKTMASTHNVIMLAGARNAVQVLIMLAIAPALPFSMFQTRIFGTHALRGLFLAAMTALMALSLHYNSFAQTYSIALGAPLISSFLARIFLKEHIKSATWAFMGLGLAGVVVALQPWGSAFAWTALIALAAAFVNGTIHVLTRLGRGENPIVMSFWTAVMATIACAITLPWTYSALTPGEMALIGLTGAVGTVGHLLMAQAFRMAPTALVSPVIYTQILWGSGIGLLFFGETVYPAIIAGAAMIIVAGIGLVLSQARR